MKRVVIILFALAGVIPVNSSASENKCIDYKSQRAAISAMIDSRLDELSKSFYVFSNKVDSYGISKEVYLKRRIMPYILTSKGILNRAYEEIDALKEKKVICEEKDDLYAEIFASALSDFNTISEKEIVTLREISQGKYKLAENYVMPDKYKESWDYYSNSPDVTRSVFTPVFEEVFRKQGVDAMAKIEKSGVKLYCSKTNVECLEISSKSCKKVANKNHKLCMVEAREKIEGYDPEIYSRSYAVHYSACMSINHLEVLVDHGREKYGACMSRRLKK